jgi:hypothetical protein
LQTLLATKLLNLTVNNDSSGLAVRASLEVLEPDARVLVQRETAAATLTMPNGRKSTTAPEIEGLSSLSVGSRIQYRLENRDRQPLYFLLIGRTSDGELMALYMPPGRSPDPLESKPDQSATDPASDRAIASPEQNPGSIAATEILTLPPSSTALPWELRGPVGVAETYLICSRAPFTQTLNLLATTLRPASNAMTLSRLINPLEVAQSILQDLQQASEQATHLAAADTIALDVTAWATLRFVYQVI